MPVKESVSLRWRKSRGTKARQGSARVTPSRRRSSRLDASQNRQVVCWSWVFSDNAQSVVDGGINQAIMSTTTPNQKIWKGGETTLLDSWFCTILPRRPHEKYN